MNVGGHHAFVFVTKSPTKGTCTWRVSPHPRLEAYPTPMLSYVYISQQLRLIQFSTEPIRAGVPNSHRGRRRTYERYARGPCNWLHCTASRSVKQTRTALVQWPLMPSDGVLKIMIKIQYQYACFTTFLLLAVSGLNTVYISSWVKNNQLPLV